MAEQSEIEGDTIENNHIKKIILGTKQIKFSSIDDAITFVEIIRQSPERELLQDVLYKIQKNIIEVFSSSFYWKASLDMNRKETIGQNIVSCLASTQLDTLDRKGIVFIDEAASKDKHVIIKPSFIKNHISFNPQYGYLMTSWKSLKDGSTISQVMRTHPSRDDYEKYVYSLTSSIIKSQNLQIISNNQKRPVNLNNKFAITALYLAVKDICKLEINIVL